MSDIEMLPCKMCGKHYDEQWQWIGPRVIQLSHRCREIICVGGNKDEAIEMWNEIQSHPDPAAGKGEPG